MANELRVRALGVGGLVENNPLAVGDTTLTSAGLAALPVIDSTNHCAIILDPDGVDGAPEVAWVTAHSSSATSATIARGKEGTTARQHIRDIPWVHGPTPYDFGGSNGACGSLLGYCSYASGSDTSFSTTSTSMVDVDSTNLKVSFVAPPSGRVLLSATAMLATTASYNGFLNFRDSGDIAGTKQAVAYGPGGYIFRASAKCVVTGLTVGTTYTYKLGFGVANAGCTFYIHHGPNTGPVLLEAWSA